MEDVEEFYRTICRVCLSYGNSENMVPLTDNSSEDGLSDYGKSVFIFTNIPLKNDFLPKKMCPKCLFLLKQAIIFRKTCERSNEKLTEFIHKVDTSDLEFKQKLSEYVMFVDSFPVRESSLPVDIDTKTHKPRQIKKIKAKSVNKTEKNIKNEASESLDFHNDDIDFEDILNCDTTSEKTLISGMTATEEDVDNVLDNMELLAEFRPQDLQVYRKRYPKKKLKEPSSKQRKRQNRNCKKTTAVKKRKSELQQSHRSQKDLQCTICSKILANPNSLLAHMQRHNGGQYICEQCGRKFATNAELKYHLAYSHDIGSQYVCKECEYKAPKMYELMEHERIHTGERPYTCDKCGLTFRRRYIWKKHALYHMEKTVPCKLCPRKFHHNGELVAHINSIHERLYIYACNHCDVTYAKTGTMRRHMAEKHGIPREMQGKIKRIKLGNTSMSSRKVTKIGEDTT